MDLQAQHDRLAQPWGYKPAYMNYKGIIPETLEPFLKPHLAQDSIAKPGAARYLS